MSMEIYEDNELEAELHLSVAPLPRLSQNSETYRTLLQEPRLASTRASLSELSMNGGSTISHREPYMRPMPSRDGENRAAWESAHRHNQSARSRLDRDARRSLTELWFRSWRGQEVVRQTQLRHGRRRFGDDQRLYQERQHILEEQQSLLEEQQRLYQERQHILEEQQRLVQEHQRRLGVGERQRERQRRVEERERQRQLESAAFCNTNRLTRLSMPELSDDSGSEPDLSILGNRGGQTDAVSREGHNPNTENAHDGAEDTSIEEEDAYGEDEEVDHYDHTNDEDMEGEEQDDDDQVEVGQALADPATHGLKEISNLGRFTVSSHKQGNGVDELRSEDLSQYWQSDGPQPHKLTVYFIKRVGIRDLRFFVNFNEDESYTPTSIIFKSGTSENNLIQFAHLTLDSPVGWQKVPLEGAGGEPDGDTLVSYVLQMQILENHQNGKDTHLRGIKIYAFDMDSTQSAARATNHVDEMVEATMLGGTPTTEDQVETDQDKRRLSGLVRRLAETRMESGEPEVTVPDWMRDPELR